MDRFKLETESGPRPDAPEHVPADDPDFDDPEHEPIDDAHQDAEDEGLELDDPTRRRTI